MSAFSLIVIVELVAPYAVNRLTALHSAADIAAEVINSAKQHYSICLRRGKVGHKSGPRYPQRPFTS